MEPENEDALIARTDRELAEMIARFRTPPGFGWEDLANDIETLLKGRVLLPEGVDMQDIERLASGHYIVCDGYCQEEF